MIHYYTTEIILRVERFMKNVLTLVLLTMSVSGTPSAALVPGRITES